MELADAVVRDAQLETAVGIRLDDVAVLPGDGVLLEARLQLADHPVGQDALGEPPEGALQAHAHLVDPELVMRVGALDAQRYVVDAHNLAAVHVDDLLVEQIAVEQQVRLVAVIRNELVVGQYDPVEADLADLVVADLETDLAVAEEVVGNAARMLSRRNRGFAYTPDARAVRPFQAKPGELGQVDQPLQADFGRRHLAVARRAHAPAGRAASRAPLSCTNYCRGRLTSSASQAEAPCVRCTFLSYTGERGWDLHSRSCAPASARISP
ncbi:MAG: hypothetical protein R2748_06960 [Bryobacterales bacterium]